MQTNRDIQTIFFNPLVPSIETEVHYPSACDGLKSANRKLSLESNRRFGNGFWLGMCTNLSHSSWDPALSCVGITIEAMLDVTPHLIADCLQLSPWFYEIFLIYDIFKKFRHTIFPLHLFDRYDAYCRLPLAPSNNSSP